MDFFSSIIDYKIIIRVVYGHRISASGIPLVEFKKNFLYMKNPK